MPVIFQTFVDVKFAKNLLAKVSHPEQALSLCRSIVPIGMDPGKYENLGPKLESITILVYLSVYPLQPTFGNSVL